MRPRSPILLPLMIHSTPGDSCRDVPVRRGRFGSSAIVFPVYSGAANMMAAVQLAPSAAAHAAAVRILEPEPNHCASCSLHRLCLPTGLEDSDMQRLDQIIGRRRRVARDGHLYRMND